jgi:NAD(P)-dependent dehydrogenase (short-subunit alcohol dehydrogenase family)
MAEDTAAGRGGNPDRNVSRPLLGRTVVVTGGSSGIGLGIARGVAKAGAGVAIWARSARRNDDAVDELRSLGGRVIAVSCDVASEQDVRDAAARTLREFTHIDAVFANAGRGSDRTDMFATDLEEWRAIQATNVEGAFLTFRECARTMIESGRPGALVGVSSLSAAFGAPGWLAYSVSKAGLLALVRGLAVELAPSRIRCNAIVPGWIHTPMHEPHRNAPEWERLERSTVRRTPAGRWGVPDDFESVAVFLADPGPTFSTGMELVIDGGYSIC